MWLDERCSCDPRQVVAELQSLDRQRTGSPTAIDWDLPVAGERRAVVPHGALLMMLDNLLNNALSAVDGRDDPRVSLSVRPVDSRVEIVVADNGPGVEPGLAERLFDYGTSSRSSGHGYGLARSRELAAHFGGSLVYAGSSAGARFVLSARAVPVASSSQATGRSDGFDPLMPETPVGHRGV